MIELTPPAAAPGARRLAAVVLDWAGTTVDFGSRAPVAAIRAAMEAAGAPVSEEEARRPMGLAKRDHLKALLESPGVSARWRERHNAEPGEADIDSIYERFLVLQAETVESHSAVIPGCVEAVAACRERGLRIGSSTGYTRSLLKPVQRRAAAEGYKPEVALTADDVSPGRPAPWLCLENARRLGVFPLSKVVKVDDTPAGVRAGRAASAWAVGVVNSGNEVGLSPEALEALPPDESERLLGAAQARLADAGAHYLVETIADLPAVIDRINARLANGESP